MGLIFLIVYFLIACIRLLNKKSILDISLVYIVIAPDIKFGNTYISAVYFLIIFFLIILLARKEKRLFISKNSKSYFILSFFSFIIYLAMTLFYSNINFSGISNIVGFLKIPLLLFLIYNIFIDSANESKSIKKAFNVLLFINLIGMALQFIFGSAVKPFFESLYLTDTYRYYASVPSWAAYNRKFGFFPSPMLLGVFSLFLVIYYLGEYNKEKKSSNLILSLLSIILGISSLSKTFIIGLPIILIAYFIYIIFKPKNRKKFSTKKSYKIIKMFPILIIVCGGMMLFFNYMKTETTIAYYLDMLSNPLEALETRYSNDSEDVLLHETYDVISDHIILGVGFQSIQNEFLGDSTYVLALHHGGVVSIISIIIFYIYNIIITFKKKDMLKFLFLIAWILSGLGMPTLFNTILILPYLMWLFGDDKNEKNN